uniref:Peptidase A1 domain-containing protein n=1 Tax=Cannabis sativa TaxID=3483 RepID=A0A803R125_CANSA
MAATSNFVLGKALVYFLTLFLVVLCRGSVSCYGFGTFGFDIHHKFSDPVRGILGFDEVPQKGTVDYYKVLVHGDHLIKGRHLASDDQTTPLAFYPGNDTVQLGGPFGYLHYANISVGTPSSSYLVALDTGSDLFWLPCDCTSCVRGIRSGDEITEFNIFSPNASSTSKKVSCNSSLCDLQRRCPSQTSTCPYQVVYLSNGTSSTGYLVEDVLHLTTDDSKLKGVKAPITFGCGTVQTGSFLEGAAPNGLIGLGIEAISVPSLLAKEGYTSNSFSMCFGREGLGRIRFGDNGSVDQGETPFSLRETHPTYNVTVTQINVGGTDANLEFSAIFDSGTSFTYLNDPAYTQISESFNKMANEDRHSSNSSIPFEYCYVLRPNQTSFEYPALNFTMKGGHVYPVKESIVVASDNGTLIYCLGVVKSENVNIIGQNFMTGYRVTFDREKLILGWKDSNCFDEEETSTLPIKPSSSPAMSPAGTLSPEATSGSVNNTIKPEAAPPRNHSSKLNSFSFMFILLIICQFFVIV